MFSKTIIFRRVSFSDIQEERLSHIVRAFFVEGDCRAYFIHSPVGIGETAY